MIHDQALGSRRNYINTMDLIPKLMDPEGVRRGMRDGSVHFLQSNTLNPYKAHVFSSESYQRVIRKAGDDFISRHNIQVAA